MSTDEQPMAAPEHQAPGQVLKERREAMGWSVEQIADALKLAPRQVVALEAGDYDSLPPAAVVRGFVRGYAKVVKIDAAPLVAAIPVDAAMAAAAASTTVRREKIASLPKVRYPSHGKRSRFPVGAVALAALAIAALAAAWHFGLLPMQGDTPVNGNTVAPPAVPANGTVTEPVAPPASAGAVNGAAPADPALQSPAVPLISVPPPAPDPSAPASGTQANPPAATPANPPANPPAAGQPPVTTHAMIGTGTAATAAAAANALVLNVKQDSWIEVRGSGRPLISRLVRAGSTETFTIGEPVTLVVGNPAGVDATLRGAPLALPALKGGTVSRQKLN